MELLSRQDLFARGRRFVQARAKKIDPAQVDVAGSNINVLVAASSYMGHAVVLQVADGIRSLTLDAEGDDLDRVVLDRFQLPRKGAGAAVTTEQFTRTAATAGAGEIPTGTRLRTLTGVEYVTLEPATFGALSLSAEAEVRAVLAGFESQVGANQIRRFVDPGLLFDPTIAANNAEPSSGGTPREQDPEYRERARNFYLAARRGTLAAVEQGALSVEGVESAHATEVFDPGLVPAGFVELVVADAAGVSNRALARRVVEKLMEYRCAGIYVTVLPSAPLLVEVQLSLAFATNVDTRQLASDVRQSVALFVNSLGASGTLRRADLFAVLSRFRTRGLLVNADAIVAPAGDVVPPPGRTIRTRLELVTIV